MAGDAAQTAANKVNPSQEELANIDRPADDNTWHDTPDTGDFKNQARNKMDKYKPFSRSDVKDAAGDTSQSATGHRDPNDAANSGMNDAQHGNQPDVDAKGGAQAGYQNLANKAQENFPTEEVKDRARNTKENVQSQSKDYLNKKMPQERRDQTIWRLKKMVTEIQGHPDCEFTQKVVTMAVQELTPLLDQQAIDTLLSLAEEYGGHSKNLTVQAAGTVKGAHTDSALTTAEADLKTLIERFANYTSADDLIEAINNIYRDADRDPELKGWFCEIDRYVRKCLKETGYILEDRANDEYNQLYDRGQYLLRNRYRDHTDRIVDELNFLARQFDADPMNKRFANAMNKLFNDLGNDENGKPTFKRHLVTDLTQVIIPSFLESVSYVPIPRIEYTDHMMDAIVENLVIESDNLTPNMLEIGSDNLYRWGRKTVASKNKNKIMVSVSGVQMDLKDVSYYVKKKSGFPSLTDKGVMDIFMGGSGFSFKIAMENAEATKSQQNFFKVNTIIIDIKNLNIKVKQSDHKLLFNLFKPLLLVVLKPVIVKVLEKVIKDNLNQADQTAYSIYQQAQREAQAAKDNPEQAQNIYQRYVSAAQRKLAEGKQKTAEVAADKKANIAMTQHDSMFKDIKLPGGISTKATEYKDLAAKGDKWESPVFSIGSAKETTSLPRANPITRKPHNTASGSVRGPQNIESGPSTIEQGDTRTTGTTGGYGSSTTGAGYGSSTTGAGYGSTTTGTGYNNGLNGSAAPGFSNQVDAAFDKNAVPATNGKTGGTLLGMKNPVLSGSV